MWPIKKQNRVEGYAGSMQPTPSIANVARRILSSLVLVWMAQFGIAIWFMIGQGYDRATADLIPIAGMGIVPAFAWLIRAGLPTLEGTTAKRMGKAMIQAATLYLVGVIVPAQAVLRGLSFSSPFDELWWLLGLSSGMLAAYLAFTKGLSHSSQAGSRCLVISALIILGSGASVLLWRAFVFSFFG
jgi:hypothetical protein